MAAGLKNNIVEKFIYVDWCMCAPQLHPKVLCFITGVLILGLGVTAAAAGCFPPSQFSYWLPGTLWGNKRQYVGNILHATLCSAGGTEGGTRGEIWTGRLLMICVSASPMLLARKVLSLSTEYKSLAPLCLLFQAKWSTPEPCSNL